MPADRSRRKTGRFRPLVRPRGDAAGRLFERREATLADTHRLCDAALAPANRTQLSGAYAALGDGAAVGSAVLVGAVSISRFVVPTLVSWMAYLELGRRAHVLVQAQPAPAELPAVDASYAAAINVAMRS